MDFDAYLKDIEYQRMVTRDKALEPDVSAAQQKIAAASSLIFIYPVYWYSMPARLKGFIDRVFTNGFAYRFFYVNRFLLFVGDILSYIPGVRYLMQTQLVTPLLTGKKAIIFRTYGGPASGKRIFGNAPKRTMEEAVLRFCGITDIKIHELFNINKPEVYRVEDEDQYLKKVEVICSKIR